VSSFANGHDEIDAETLVRRVVEVVSNAKSVPLSSSVMVTKDEVLELLEDALERLPEELRQARWMLKEREEFLAKVAREGDDILEQARVRAERMVERQERTIATSSWRHSRSSSNEPCRRREPAATSFGARRRRPTGPTSG
jgi:cell division septum initiation protein DivIVA